MMEGYKKKLYRLLEEQERKRAEAAQAASIVAAQTPVPKPLDVQLEEYLASLPPARANGPFLMSEIVEHLQGRYSDKPHPQQVAAELRKLDFQRIRLYGKEHQGRRMWIKPTHSD